MVGAIVNGNREHLLAYLSKTKGGSSIGSLTNRKIVQKKVYLLQKLGLDMKYDFGWYIYGPYSTELAYDLYQKEAMIGILKNDPSNLELSKYEDSVLQKLDDMLDRLGNDKPLDYWLELLASLHMCGQIDYLKKLKPGKFEDRDIELCWRVLVDAGLLG